MDNRHKWNANTAGTLEEVTQLPREEVIARLYSIIETYEASEHSGGVLCPLSLDAAARGLYSPHRLRFGCCRKRQTDPAA